MKMLLRTTVFTPVMIWTLVVTTFVLGWFPPEGRAMLAPATSASVSDPGRAEDLQSIQRVLENKLVQQRLEDLGLTPEEVNAKLSGLSDAQLHQMAAQLDALMPGGELGLIIALLVIAILVVIFIYLLDRRIEIKKNS
ncbi:MAG TPA: PA2779 family protein [Nitrospirales bacterium]|jgi:hypothetical protein|nr:PA2779 family protein [Nitrospirales bacterium]